MPVALSLPIPVMVRMEDPRAVLLLVVTFSRDDTGDPEAVRESGLRLAMAPVGTLFTVKLTGPVNPPAGVTVTV